MAPLDNPCNEDLYIYMYVLLLDPALICEAENSTDEQILALAKSLYYHYPWNAPNYHHWGHSSKSLLFY